MPALMKASPYIIVYYRNGSHTISVVWPTLTYATEIAYSPGSFTPNIIDRWSVYWQQLK